MSYLLDTNACIHFLNGAHRGLIEKILAHGPQALVVSTVSVAELEYGAARSSRPKANMGRIAALLSELHVEPFTQAHAAMFGRVKADLVKRGVPIADFDIAIAATALVLGLPVISDDADMGRVRGLSVENWCR